MDCTNFTEFIKQSDNDKNNIKEAKVEHHAWRLLPAAEEEEELFAARKCYDSNRQEWEIYSPSAFG